MAIGDGANLLFRIKGDASDAIRAFDQTKTAQTELTGTTGALGGAFAGLLNPVTLITVGITAVASAAIATGTALFNLTKQAAEYGDEIFDATEKTGLSAEAIQALKYAAEQSGSSFEAITNSVAKFNVLLGQAQNGNEKAEATLKQYGITAQTTDEALKQAVITIANMTSSTQQAAAAHALFKDRAGAILPVIKSFDGDLKGLIERLEKMGVIMSENDVRAAAALNDQLDDLDRQANAVWRTIGTQLIPVLADLARQFSDFLTKNQAQIKAWSVAIADAVKAVIKQFSQLRDFIVVMGKLAGGDFLGAQTAFLSAVGAQSDLSGNVGIGGGFKLPGGTNPEEDDSAQKEAEKRLKERMERASREIRANLEIELNNLKTQKDTLKKEIEDLRDAFVKSGNAEQFMSGVAEAFGRAKGYFGDTLKFIEALEKQALGADATQGEKNLLIQKQLERRNELVQLGIDLQEKNKKIVTDASDEIIKKHKEEAQAFTELVEVINEGTDAMAGFNHEIKEGIGTPEYSPFQPLIDSWQSFIDLVDETGPTLGQTMEAIGGLAVEAFSGFANALGNVVENWVLLGETGPAVMRKILAQALATLAAEAAVRALWELALGFASLAFGDFEAAAFHFTSAAIFGAVAGVAAIAGRAVAGDAFKKQTGAANSKSASSSNPQGERGGVGAYSQYGDKALIKEEGRNSPGLGPIGVDVNIKFQDKPKWFSSMFYEEWKANGKLRRTMRDEIEK